MRFNKFWQFIASLAIALSAGAIGSYFTASAIEGWYVNLVKPALMPPGWVFGPVWTALYILMGISLYLVWVNGWKVVRPIHQRTRKAWNPWSERLWRGDWKKWNLIAIFAIQYLLNIKWSFVFFGLRLPILAFFVILALWVSIIYLIVNFYRISKSAAWLLLPYFAWVTFAIYLNWMIWRLN